MKFTNKQLKQIIKEELEQVILEEEEITEQNSKEQEIMKAAQALSDSPEMDRIFAKLNKDQQVQKLLSKLANSEQVNEEVFGMGDDSGAGFTATATAFLGYPSAGAFLQSAGGKLLLAKVGSILGMGTMATVGVGAIGFLGPIAIGFLLDVMANKMSKGAEQ